MTAARALSAAEISAIAQLVASGELDRDQGHIVWSPDELCHTIVALAAENTLLTAERDHHFRTMRTREEQLKRLSANQRTGAIPNVEVCRMSESSGKITWYVQMSRPGSDSMLDGISVYSSLSKGRADYHADELRYALGLRDKPDLLAYDTDIPQTALMRRP